MPRRTLVWILAVVVISLACYERTDRNPYGRWFSEILERIHDDYVEPIDEQLLFEGALDGMVRRLDDYSAFLPRSKKTQFEEAIEQHYGGIGIEVSREGSKKQFTVLSPLVGSPAFKAGIRNGDRIVAVDRQSTEKMSLDDLVRLLRGKPGDEVLLSVSRDGHAEPLDFRLVRKLIKTDSVLGDLRREDGSWNFFLPGDQRIGYVRIQTFGESTVDEFRAALAWLAERKCRGLVIDLRNNPGGLLPAAVRICELFLPADSLIVSTRGRQRARFTADDDGPYQRLPLVVLVNGNSASASEIVAAALQDHHRATIVGERTYGKGTVQSVIPVEGGNGLLKLTSASYWRPNGKNIQRASTSQEDDDWGVRPDSGTEIKLDDRAADAMQEKRRMRDVLPMPADTQDAHPPAPPATASPLEFDPQLRRAVEVLEQKLEPSPAAHAA